MLNHTRTHTDETLVRQTSGTQASFHVCTRTTEFCGSATRAGHVISSSLPNRPRQMVRYAQAYVSECFIPTSTFIPKFVHTNIYVRKSNPDQSPAFMWTCCFSRAQCSLIVYGLEHAKTFTNRSTWSSENFFKT